MSDSKTWSQYLFTFVAIHMEHPVHHIFPPQSEVNAANRTSETIMKNIGAEKKVQDSKVLKKLSGDEAVQVCM